MGGCVRGLAVDVTEHVRQQLLDALSHRESVMISSNGLKESSVLVAVEASSDGTLNHSSMILTRRTQGVPTHQGQVAFAGGKVSKTDKDLWATAHREAHEEIGLAPGRPTRFCGLTTSSP